LEGSPETIDKGKLLTARELGINRISIGVESWNDNLLQDIRRRHDVSLAERTVKLIQSCDLPLDIDLIRGLPGSDLDTIFRDAHTSAGLNIDSVTSYQYTQKPRSIDSKINNYDLDRQDTMLQHLCFRRLMQHYGYTENPVDWFACRNDFYNHNILKWQHNADQISVGLGSYGYVGGCSYTNHAREANYYLALDQYLLPIEKSESLTLNQQMQRHIVFGLKTGVNLTDVQEQYDQNVWCGEFGQKLQSLLTQGVLEMHDHKIKPTEISRLITDDLQVWLCQPTI
jgi:oxygen-independent coproporphyrinogen-3 oxidase